MLAIKLPPLTPPFLSVSLLSSSQIQCKSARAIAMATESVILACAIASQDSMAWTALKVFGMLTECFFPSDKHTHTQTHTRIQTKKKKISTPMPN